MKYIIQISLLVVLAQISVDAQSCPPGNSNGCAATFVPFGSPVVTTPWYDTGIQLNTTAQYRCSYTDEDGNPEFGTFTMCLVEEVYHEIESQPGSYFWTNLSTMSCTNCPPGGSCSETGIVQSEDVQTGAYPCSGCGNVA
jgi:hypothetical protein